MAARADRELLSRMLLVVASLAAVLTAAALATALVVEPPPLGWVGFAVLSLVVFALGAAATLAVPRLRVSPPVPIVADDHAQRLLVVADPVLSPSALADAICTTSPRRCSRSRRRARSASSHLHFLTDDESRERRQAEGSLAHALRTLHERGVVATGAVGDDKPLGVDDRRARRIRGHSRPARDPARTRVVLVGARTAAEGRALTAVEVDQIVVPATLAAGRARCMFELVGVVGIVISVIACLPQVVHLARQHCWQASAVVPGRCGSPAASWSAPWPVHRHDPVFILLQGQHPAVGRSDRRSRSSVPRDDLCDPRARRARSS